MVQMSTSGVNTERVANLMQSLSLEASVLKLSMRKMHFSQKEVIIFDRMTRVCKF